MQATPRLSEDKVKQCIDPRMNGDYPPKAVAKVSCALFIFIYACLILSCWMSVHEHLHTCIYVLSFCKPFSKLNVVHSIQSRSFLWDASEDFVLFVQFAAVAALCVQYEAEFRPNMSIVVKALSPLLLSKQVAPLTASDAPSLVS